MAKSNRTCYLCGEKYEYCPNCGRHDPTYKATFCSENCKDIFKSLCSYGSGTISAEDCKELLDCCDLSKKLSYKESVQNTIEQVYATSVAVIVEDKVETKEEVIVEEIKPVEEIQPVEVVEAIPEVITEEQVEAIAEIVEAEAEVVVEEPVIHHTRKSRKHEVVLEDKE